jgi:DNA-binding MarR family transcriptional regulator
MKQTKEFKLDEGATERQGIAKERESALSAMLSMRIVHLFLSLRRTSAVMQPKELVLSRLEWRVMTQLDGTKPHSLSSLADRLMLDRGQLSRAVKDMVERGLLTRSRKPGGPEIEIDLSSDGLLIRSAMIDRAGDRDRFLTEGLDPEDQAVAFKVIEHMIVRAGMLPQELGTIAKD